MLNTVNKNKSLYQVSLPRFYLIDRRKELQMSVDELSIKLDIGRKYYYLIESGNRGKRMSLDILQGLITHLQFDAAEFIRLEKEYLKERKRFIKK